MIKPLPGVENSKIQPIVRRLNNLQVAITPYQLSPLNRVTKPFLNQMVSFNEYQENCYASNRSLDRSKNEAQHKKPISENKPEINKSNFTFGGSIDNLSVE